MLSRVADSLYWMSRYLERAEHTARVLGVHWNLMLEQPPEASTARWRRVRKSLAVDSGRPASDSTHDVLEELCFSADSPVSIVAAIMAARDNARQVREQISSEMWEQLNRLFHEVRRPGQEEWWHTDPVEFLDEIKDASHLFQGLTDSTMSHGEGWHFIQLGRFLERALDTVALVDSHFQVFESAAEVSPHAVADAGDYLEWIGLLKCATAFEAYCKEYTAAIEPSHVADFLLINEEFPHSLRFALSRVQAAMNSISEVSPSRRGNKVQRLAGRAATALGYSQIEEVMTAGLHSALEDIRRQCAHIHSGVYQAFIAYPIETALEV
jgi:uncharacterized alpha-E superfamily protein